MPRKSKADAREAILGAAVDVIKERGARSVTVDGVAKRAGCAKGLVHYHFKTKAGLLQAVADRLALKRRESWETAFAASSPKAAIERSWNLLTGEASDGVGRAWASLFAASGVLPDSAVRAVVASFSDTLGRGAIDLMARADLEPTIPATEIGWLLGAVVHGMALQLQSGAQTEPLEGAYAAAWLGILSLFAPAPG